MDYFRDELSKFLNSTQNPTVKLNDISTSIDYIHDLIQNHKFIFPEIDEDFKELLSNNNISNYKLFTKLIEKKEIDGKLTKIGYNTLKVKLLHSDYDLSLLFEMLDSFYIQTYENVFKIGKNCSTDMNLLKSLCYLLIDNSDIFYNDLSQFNETDHTFPFIFRQDKYELDREDISYVSIFLMIYGYLFLTAMYRSTGHFYVELLNVIDNDPAKPEIIDDFESYLENNKINIIDKMASFCTDNVLSLSGTISTVVIEELSDIFETAMLKLPDVLIDSNVIKSDIISSIVYDSTIQIYTWTATKNLFSSFYEELDSLLNISKSYNEFVAEEEASKDESIKWFDENIKELQMLEYIPYQFSLTPLFFFNTYYIVHKQFSIDLINRTSSNFNVRDWINSISYDNNSHKDGLYDYLESHPLEYDHNIIKLCSFLHLNKIIDSFCNSDEFKSWIINDIFIEIRKKLSLQYLYHLDEYKFVDDIRLYFKLIFMKDILDDILFNSYISVISNNFNSSIVNCTTTDILSMNIETFNSFFDQDTISNLLDDFFKSSIVSKYLNGILSNYSLE